MPNPSHALGSIDFDPLAFLGRAGSGKTLERYRKDQKIFAQGEDADAVFFIRSGKVKITVLSEHGKEAVIGFLTNPTPASSKDGPDKRGRVGARLGEAALSNQKRRAPTNNSTQPDQRRCSRLLTVFDLCLDCPNSLKFL